LPNENSLCDACELNLESIWHCLLDCHQANQVWLRVLRILQKQRNEGGYYVGFTSIWFSISQVAYYDSNLGLTSAIVVSERRICQIPMNFVHQNDLLLKQSKWWMVLIGRTMWHKMESKV
jgi:hypothetical protein